MATKKQEISKHKSAMAHKAAAKSDMSQVFDIMPRSRVRATATSRPVITGNKPAVNDNTLATAPILGLNRHSTVIAPPKSASGSSVTSDNTSIASSESASVEGKSAAPGAKGVSVAELLAKRSASQGASQESVSQSAASSDSDSEKSVEGLTLDEPKPSDSEIEVGTSIDLSPANPVNAIDQTASKDSTLASEKNESSKLDTDFDEMRAVIAGSEELKAPETEKAVSEPAPTKPVESDIDSDEALAKVLQGGAAAKPQVHSEALKEEIKNLGEDGREHHELYGGKPVIVVHKDKGALSAAMWVVWFLVCVLLAVAIVNVLLDAGIIQTGYDIPYTDFIKE